MLLAHINLAVPNVEETALFYNSIFGWQIRDRTTPSGAWLRVGPNQELHLTERTDFVSSQFEGELGRHFAIAVRESELDAIVEKLQSQQVTLISPKRNTRFRRLFFRDSNGYIVELFVID